VISVLEVPLELLGALRDTIRALAELPVALERNLRETNAVIAESRAQLEVLGEQARSMMAQLEKMATVTDGLVEGTRTIAAVARDAQRQMALTTEQLAATNRNLEQIVRMAEPLDRLGKRVAESLQRVTGRRSPPDEESE
jgi:ABC-type transporter Mla subunit MlaD